MGESYLHITYIPSSDGNWLPRLMNRLQKSSSATLQGRMNSWAKTPLKDMGLTLATKLAMLSQVTRRFDMQFQRLAEHLREEEDEVRECVQTRSSYRVPENELPYELLVDIDCFLFESRSTYEMVGKFLREFYYRILDRKVNEDEIKSMLSERGADVRWIEELSQNRNLFIHETAPWIALKIESIKPLGRPFGVRPTHKTFCLTRF